MVIVVVALAWDREITIAYTRTYREKQLFQRGEGAWRLRYGVHYRPTNLLPTVTKKRERKGSYCLSPGVLGLCFTKIAFERNEERKSAN